jgi:hypothetical protein
VPPPPPRLEVPKLSGSRQDATTAGVATTAEEGPDDADAEVGSRPDSPSLRRRGRSATSRRSRCAPPPTRPPPAMRRRLRHGLRLLRRRRARQRDVLGMSERAAADASGVTGTYNKSMWH